MMATATPNQEIILEGGNQILSHYPSNDGLRAARKMQKWSVKGGKKTIKSFRGLNKKGGKSNG
jgi:hypothetical protein